MSYRFKDARVQSGISQKDAAEQLQVSAATVEQLGIRKKTSYD